MSNWTIHMRNILSTVQAHPRIITVMEIFLNLTYPYTNTPTHAYSHTLNPKYRKKLASVSVYSPQVENNLAVVFVNLHLGTENQAINTQ